MNASIISALAALVGAAIGGLTSVLASWLTQQTQAKAQWSAQERVRRQDLYKGFIEEASQCYVDALQHDKPDISALVGIYAKIDRMRVQSSQSGRKCRARRTKDRRCLSGTGQQLPRTARDAG